MATLGEQFYHRSGDSGSVDWYGDIDIVNVVRTGNTVRVIAYFYLRAQSRVAGTACAWYNYGMRIHPTYSDGSLVPQAEQVILGNGEQLCSNQASKQSSMIDMSFTVAASATSYNLGVRMFTCNNSTCSSRYFDVTKYWAIRFPSGANVTYSSSTWNSITATSSVASWGTGYTGTPNLEQIVVDPSANASNWTTKGRRAKQNATTATSSTQAVTNNNSVTFDGGINIKGAMDYKLAVWANTNLANTSYFRDTTYHTPPAPLQSIEYSQTRGSSSVSVALTITGGTSTNNYGNTVTTYYCYSTNGGSTFTNWTSAGTGTPWTAKSATISVPFSSSIVVKAKQTYSGLDSAEKSVSFTSLSGVAPSGANIVFGSSTWNSVTATASVSSWGSGYTGTPKLEHIVVDPSATSSNWTSKGRQVLSTSTTSTSKSQTVTTSNSTATSGGYAIKGAMNFKLASRGVTSAGTTSYFRDTTYYTPPAPLQSITYTQTQNSTNVTVNATITGGNSSNNYGNTVTTYYRYSTNGGSSYTNWASAGTGTPWTGKNISFNCAYGANVIIKAKQTYQSKDSNEYTVSFTATNGTTPSGGSVEVIGSTWNSVTLQASGVNYGKPDGISTRTIIVGVTPDASSYAYKREVGLGAVTSGTGTVNNNSAYGGSAQPFTLKGMRPVYAYVWVNNTVQSAFVEHKSTPYYLPPAPGQLSYTLDSQTAASKTYTVSYTGVAANNVLDYTPSDLKRTVRYSTDNGATWTYVANDVQEELTTATSFQVSIAAQHSVVVQSWMTYKGKQSDVSAVTIYNGNRPAHLYGSVDGLSEEIEHLYGSVNGESKKVVRLYGSVGGVTKGVFEDV